MADVARSPNNDQDDAVGAPDAGTPSFGGPHTSSASAVQRTAKHKKKRSFWKELPILLAVALLLTFLIQTFIARVFLIPSESMEQTLHGCAGCYGDRVVVDKVVYAFSEPEPGDVVVFERPSTWNQTEFRSDRSTNTVVRWLQDIGAMFGLAPPDEDDVVKRVIAVGGQTVWCCDERGRVVVDGKPLHEPYIYWQGGVREQDPFERVTVPDGHLFVMGDNRNNSTDSRSQGGGGINGMVPVDNVIGKARFIVLPPSRWQGVGDDNPQAVALSALVGPSGLPALPLAAGLAGAFPVVWLGRRARGAIRGGGR